MKLEGIARTEKGWKYYSYIMNPLGEETCLEVEENGMDHYHIAIRTPVYHKEFNILRNEYDTTEVDGVLQVAEMFKHDPQAVLKRVMEERPDQVRDVMEK